MILISTSAMKWSTNHFVERCFRELYHVMEEDQVDGQFLMIQKLLTVKSMAWHVRNTLKDCQKVLFIGLYLMMPGLFVLSVTGQDRKTHTG